MFRIQIYINCLLKRTSTTRKTLIERHGSNMSLLLHLSHELFLHNVLCENRCEQRRKLDESAKLVKQPTLKWRLPYSDKRAIS